MTPCVTNCDTKGRDARHILLRKWDEFCQQSVQEIRLCEITDSEKRLFFYFLQKIGGMEREPKKYIRDVR